jgi:NAD-dependent dihydropyrimidine dehydrogenase PreA subunit
MDVLRLDEIHKKAVIKYGEDCMGCLCCELDCPTKAIYVSTAHKPQIRSWG